MTKNELNGYAEYVAVGIAMEQFGGGFMGNIGKALQHADSVNRRKVKETWPEEWERYLRMAKMMRMFGGDR